MDVLVRKPKAIIFDWDDTLVDNWNAIHHSLNATLTQFNHKPWSIKKARSNVRLSLRDSFPNIFGEEWEIAAKFFYDKIEQNHLKTLVKLNFSEDILKFLSNCKIKMGIVSNKTGPILRKECQHLEWNKYFESIIGANDAKNDKPSADPLLLCLEEIGIPANKLVWFVGDAPSDIECANNANVTSVLIDTKFEPSNTEYPLADMQHADLESLLESVKKLNNSFKN